MTRSGFRTGDAVWLEADGVAVKAQVALASDNGRSLMLLFDGFVGGFLGSMPVLDETGAGDWRALNGQPVRVTAATSRAIS